MDDRSNNSSRAAILGLLLMHDASGYDIRKLAEGSIGHFWSESYGQIYPTLKRLVRDDTASSKLLTTRTSTWSRP